MLSFSGRALIGNSAAYSTITFVENLAPGRELASSGATTQEKLRWHIKEPNGGFIMCL